MRTDRSYRKALSHEVAMTELLASSGGQLDRRVVDALAEIVGPQAALEAARAKAIDAAGTREDSSSALAGSLAH
jgi:HD-GYP domain-containing protein (c-di-GMP phosphodiesterase class II)